MPETKRILGGAVGPDEVLADKCPEELVQGCSVRAQPSHGLPREESADDRGALEKVTLIVAQSVDASREKRLNRCRRLDLGEVADRVPAVAIPSPQTSFVEQHRQHLLDEERIAFAGSAEGVPDLLRDLALAQQVLDQRVDRGVPKRLEQDRRRVQLAAAPQGPLVEELRPRHADEQDPGIAGPVSEMVEEIEEGRLGPLHVVEDEDDGAILRQRLDQLANRPEGLLAGRLTLGEAGGRRESTGNEIGLGLRREHRDEARMSLVGRRPRPERATCRTSSVSGRT